MPARWPLGRPPYLLETSDPGVFAAGDVRHRSMKRVTLAAGEGSTAISLIHEYLQESVAGASGQATN
jgi:thioredoxin reductase (NADPH)